MDARTRTAGAVGPIVVGAVILVVGIGGLLLVGSYKPTISNAIEHGVLMPADYELLRFASIATAVLGAVMIGGAFQPDHGGRRDGKSGFESRTELRIYRHNYS